MRDEPGGAADQVVCTRAGCAADNAFILCQPCTLQQDFVLHTEQSSERSSQEDWAMSSQGRLISHGSHDVSWTGSGGMSSHGSIGAAGKGEVQEQACTSACPSLDRSGSCGRGAAELRAAEACEDADATSTRPHSPAQAGGMQTRLRGGAVSWAGTPAQSPGSREVPHVEGTTASERAENALRVARAAAVEARQKARRALEEIAAAQQRRAAEERPAKRKRRQVLRAYAGPPSHLLLGARISVYWPDDDAFYKGRIVEVREDSEEARVVYDDEMEEWLALASERFRWLAPRAASAGGTRALQAEMARLGAEGVSDAPHAPNAAAAPLRGEPAPPGGAAVGGCLALHFAGAGAWCRAEVLAYDDVREMHYLVYEDGEHEWVCLRKEAHLWSRPEPGSSHHAGLGPGAAVPSEGKAIGWRVGTYWAESAAFYEGEVVGYDNASGRHHLVYDGGEQEHVLLTSVKVRWVMPPSAGAHQPAVGKLGLTRLSPPAFAAEGSPDSGRSSRRGATAVGKKGRAAPVRDLPMKRGRARTQLRPWLKDELADTADADAQLLGFGGMALAAGLCRDDGFGAAGEQQRQGWWQAPEQQLPGSCIRDRRTHNGCAAARALFPAEPAPLRGGRRGGWPAALGLPPAGAHHVSAPEPPLQPASSLPTAASLQLDELISELADAGGRPDDGANCHEGPIMSAGLGLEPLDLSLPMLPDLAPLGGEGLRGLLLEGLAALPGPGARAGAPGSSASLARDVAGAGVPLGSSEHGSCAAESLLQGGTPQDDEGDLARGSEAGIAHFLSAGDGLLGEADGAASQPKEEFGGQALTLASARSSIVSLASDSTAVGLSSCHSSTFFHNGGAPASGAPTPESIRVARPWEDGSQLCVPLEPLHASHAMEQPRMDAPMNDGLVMTNELQRLLADMDWG